MALATVPRTVGSILTEAETPPALIEFVTSTLKLTKVNDFVAYVIKKEYEAELETEWHM